MLIYFSPLSHRRRRGSDNEKAPSPAAKGKDAIAHQEEEFKVKANSAHCRCAMCMILFLPPPFLLLACIPRNAKPFPLVCGYLIQAAAEGGTFYVDFRFGDLSTHGRGGNASTKLISPSPMAKNSNLSSLYPTPRRSKKYS